MTGPRFDDVVHAPLRLRLCAILATVDSAEFRLVRDSLEVSDSVLSKHVATLERAGYVAVSKHGVAGRVRTSLVLTRAGRDAYEGHVAELRRIVEG